MRQVFPSSKFRRDMKREQGGIHRKLLVKGGELERVMLALANDESLPLSYRDHALHHNWEGSRDCHIRPDFILIYTLEGDDVLVLERLGSHSEVFGL